MTNANAKSKVISAFCRACHTRIRFDKRPELFDMVSCPECGEEFEVVGLAPIRLDWPSGVVDDVDWPDDDYDDLYGNWGSAPRRFLR